jgi:hypothetical protein
MSTNSNASLLTLLGFVPGDSIFVETTPDWYTQFADDNQLELEPGLPATHAHIFCLDKSELDDFLKDNELADIERFLWISWPTQTSDQQSAFGENEVRAALAPLGWVGAQPVSLDAAWSGLQFSHRQD